MVKFLSYNVGVEGKIVAHVPMTGNSFIHSHIIFIGFCYLTGILVLLTILKAGVLEAKRRLSVRMVPMLLCPTLT